MLISNSMRLSLAKAISVAKAVAPLQQPPEYHIVLDCRHLVSVILGRLGSLLLGHLVKGREELQFGGRVWHIHAVKHRSPPGKMA